MIKQVFLISPSDIKNNSRVEIAVEDKTLRELVLITQETKLSDILGDSLYSSIIDTVYEYKENNIEIPSSILSILTHVKKYLQYQVIADFISVNNYKLTDKGTNKLSDNNAVVSSNQDLEWYRTYYDNAAASYKKKLIDFLKQEDLLLSSENTDTDYSFRGVYMDFGEPLMNMNRSTITSTSHLNGFQGAQGIGGAQGVQGPVGAGELGSGLQGVQGVQGNNGNDGLSGAQGFQGNAGSNGVQGVAGSSGVQGPQGSIGNSGTQGVQGNVGSNGAQGSQGLQGVAGNGVQGFQGNIGSNGNQGFQGFQGVAGNGAQGLQGVKGSTGSNGSQGYQGLQGVAGNGAQGFQGDRGLTGSQGFQGSIGTGVQGLQGVQGNNGNDGLSGVQGFQGSAGSNGTQGFQGDRGLAGSQGLQGIDGLTGTQGLQGVQGAQGIIGVQGSGFNSILNPSNNRILTATGSSTTSALANTNLTFDGSKLTVTGTNSGNTVLDVQGTSDQLMSVTDTLTGTILSVNNISGIPLMQVNTVWGASMGVDFRLNGYLIDKLGSSGPSGYFLSATGNGVQWVAPSSGYTIVSVTSTYSVTPTSGEYVYLVYGTSSVVSINLPTAVGNTAKYTVKKVDTSSNGIYINTSISQKIDSGLSASITTQNGSITLVSNSANWFII